MKNTIKGAYVYYTLNSAVEARKVLLKWANNVTGSWRLYSSVLRMRLMFDPEVLAKKNRYRNKYLRKRKSTEVLSNIKKHSDVICDTVAGVLEFYPVRDVALYKSTKYEINTDFLFDALRKKDINIYYPKINSNEELEFILVDNIKDFTLGKHKMLEPTGKIKLKYLQDLDAIIVPGVCFNTTTGARLGRGKGHYDKVLGKIPKTYKIGLTLSTFTNSNLPQEAHDINMDAILTENGTIWVNGK